MKFINCERNSISPACESISSVLMTRVAVIIVPESYPENCVAYTGTHDNETLVGWLNSRASRYKPGEDILEGYLDASDPDAYWQAVSEVVGSNANTIILPLQDLLGLGSSARMNVPGLADGNWGWRIESHQMTSEVAARFKQLLQRCGRTGNAVSLVN